jgi:hypothetical protein
MLVSRIPSKANPRNTSSEAIRSVGPIGPIWFRDDWPVIGPALKTTLDKVVSFFQKTQVSISEKRFAFEKVSRAIAKRQSA